VRRLVLVLAIVTLGLPMVVTTSAPAASTVRTIRVDGRSFAFEPNTITISAGERVKIVYRSLDVYHDLVVQGIGRVVKANGGKTRRGTLTITEPGTYKFWCSVRGHRSGGMKGTITVT
jgi:plastocyanin